jgi:tetratricopeptide (TPR) repeat protein
VANILEGSVQKLGNKARISTQLIKVSDGFQMWSDTYNRELTDIFAVQQEIAQAVTGALQLKLLGNTAQAARPASAGAYDAYLMGRYFLGKSNKENLEKAVVHFNETIELDPRYAPAWVGLGASKINQAGGNYIPVEEGYKEARTAVEKALSLDPNLGEAHSALGWLQMLHDSNWTAADQSIQRALVLEPGNAIVVSHAGILARIMGRFDEAANLGRRAMQLDPLSTGVHHNAGLALYYAGLYEDSVSAYRKALEIFPEYAMEHCFIGLDYLMESRTEEALAEMDREKNPALRVFGLALAYHAAGKKKESDLNLAELVKYGPCYQIGETYAFRGETDRAFELLEQCVKLDQLKGDPLLKSLVRDPRYTALLKKAHLPL